MKPSRPAERSTSQRVKLWSFSFGSRDDTGREFDCPDASLVAAHDLQSWAMRRVYGARTFADFLSAGLPKPDQGVRVAVPGPGCARVQRFSARAGAFCEGG